MKNIKVLIIIISFYYKLFSCVKYYLQYSSLKKQKPLLQNLKNFEPMNVPFLYPLKTSKNRVLMVPGVKKWNIGLKWVN